MLLLFPPHWPGLCSSSTLSHLDLEENELGEEAGQHLAAVLKGCKALAWLRMDGEADLSHSVNIAWFGEGGGQHLAAVLGGCKALAWLRADGEDQNTRQICRIV